MDAKSVTIIIAAGISLFVGIWVISVISSSVALPSYTRGNESINFVANNTEYATVYTPILTVTSMWNDSAHTYLYATTKYAVTSTGIKIYTNGTTEGAYNVTTGTHYFDYTYQSSSANTTFTTTTGIVWNAIQLLSVVLIITAAGVILAYFGFGKRE